MATLLSPDMLPEDIRNMDFGQASMPHAPEAQTPEVPYDTTTSAPDRPAIPLSPDMLSGNLRENDSEKSGIEFSFDAFGYTQQVELVQESYADGNLAGRSRPPCRDAGRVPRGTRKRIRQRVHGCLGKRLRPERRIPCLRFRKRRARNLRYDPCGTTYEPCEGGAIGMSRFHSNRTCIRSPTAIPSSQNTPLC